jgi:hypothetical protein
MKTIVIICLSIIIFSCCKQEKKNKLAASPIMTNKEEFIKDGSTIHNIDTIIFSKISKQIDLNHPWIAEWNNFISSEIKNNRDVFINADSIYKNDILKLCPNYFEFKENDKVAFWTLLIASIARFESKFDPNCRYQEGASLDSVFSEGLLQLSYGDETRYKNVLLNTEKQNILVPEVNLKTGVVIFAKQLKTRKTIFTSRHFYWSVLTNKQNEIVQFFKANMAELKLCD